MHFFAFSIRRRALLVSLTAALPTLSLLPTAAQQIVPLTADPARAVRPAAVRAAVAARRTAALSLPVFDDFADPRFGPLPNPAIWDTTGGAFRNETLARKPLTRGVVTFDGLDRFGRARGSVIGGTDTLTSLPIDLVGRTGVVLSFWVQAGSILRNLDAPGSNSALALDFDDGVSGTWDLNKWRQTGTGANTDFTQVFVPIPAVYLTSTFRFRFRATGSQRGFLDPWSIDYVVLDANRVPQPTPLNDVALSRSLGLPLGRYSAMPVWQFNAAPVPTDLLPDTLGTSINNLEPDPLANPTPLGADGVLTARATGGVVATVPFATGVPYIVPANVRQLPLTLPFRPGVPAGAIPLTADYKTLTAAVWLQSGEPNPATRYNDTLRRTATLADFYAQDDGTAEAALNFGNASGPAAYCVGFSLSEPDQVDAIQLYIAGGAVPGTPMAVNVWDDSLGVPRRRALTTVGFQFPTEDTLRATGRWWTVRTPRNPTVSGRFYVGVSVQVASSPPAATNLGIDFNDTVSVTGQTFRRSFTDPWRLVRGNGRLMIRARMNHNGILGTAEGTASAVSFSVWPNPLSRSGAAALRLSGPARTPLALLDALGRTVGTVPPGADAVSVRELTPGVYWLRPLGGGRGVRVVVTD